jgi:hypothetical protein
MSHSIVRIVMWEVTLDWISGCKLGDMGGKPLGRKRRSQDNIKIILGEISF